MESAELLQRYVDMRHRLNQEVDVIYSITSMLAQFKHSGKDSLSIDPVALGNISHMLNSNILRIWEILDDFIYLAEARLELERLAETN